MVAHLLKICTDSSSEDVRKDRIKICQIIKFIAAPINYRQRPSLWPQADQKRPVKWKSPEFIAYAYDSQLQILNYLRQVQNRSQCSPLPLNMSRKTKIFL